ncbi:MAG: ABC transporter permease [Chryseobacterium sp.]|nr:MAG: ABC transporter permease [Chryseobacterium sp.]
MKSVPLYIARRYLRARKGSQAVSFITGLAAFAMMVAVASMFIIVSVFSGLEKLNRDLIENIHADITVSSSRGKPLNDPDKVVALLSADERVAHFSKLIEEKVYIEHRNNGDIAYLRAVDSVYTQVNPIDKTIFYGSYPSFEFSNEVLMENQLDNRLSIAIGDEDPATLIMPRPGTGIINREEDIFNKKEIYVTGVFPGNDQLNNYIIAPIELGRQLLDLPAGSAYQVVVKLKDGSRASQFRKDLAQKLGSDFTVKTKEEENSAFWKMIHTEKLMIYLIFALVIFITTFNLAGAIIIIQLDKREQARSLISIGFTKDNLRKIYFYTGMLITLFGIVSGLIIGSVVGVLQQQFGWFRATEVLPFPVRIVPENYYIVAATALFFGTAVSWIFSGKARKFRFNFR